MAGRKAEARDTGTCGWSMSRSDSASQRWQSGSSEGVEEGGPPASRHHESRHWTSYLGSFPPGPIEVGAPEPQPFHDAPRHESESPGTREEVERKGCSPGVRSKWESEGYSDVPTVDHHVGKRVKGPRTRGIHSAIGRLTEVAHDLRSGLPCTTERQFIDSPIHRRMAQSRPQEGGGAVGDSADQVGCHGLHVPAGAEARFGQLGLVQTSDEVGNPAALVGGGCKDHVTIHEQRFAQRSEFWLGQTDRKCRDRVILARGL